MFYQKQTQNKGGNIYFLLKRSLMQIIYKKLRKKLKMKEKKRRSAKTNKNIQDLCYNLQTECLCIVHNKSFLFVTFLY